MPHISALVASLIERIMLTPRLALSASADTENQAPGNIKYKMMVPGGSKRGSKRNAKRMAGQWKTLPLATATANA